LPVRLGLILMQESDMDSPTPDEITKRAFEIWEKNGQPEGRNEEFYHLAEQELRNRNKSSPLRTPDNL
jgi:hypothetical protein